MPFYLSSPDRTRESIARVFRGLHIPQRLVRFVHNEIDALLVLLSVELRLWSRASQVGQPSLIERFEEALRDERQDSTLGSAFVAGLRFLCAPNQGSDRERSLTISFRRDKLTMQARTRLLGLADLVEVAERLALFMDEPRFDEQPDEAGELRRALRRGVQLSSGNSDRCVVRLPALSFRRFRDATSSVLTGSFLPTVIVRGGQSPTAESRWIQILVEATPDDDETVRPLSLIDRVKRVAAEKQREFTELGEHVGRPSVKLNGHANIARFFASSKQALILLGAGGAGKSTLVGQVASESRGSLRTTLIIALRRYAEAASIGAILRAALGLETASDTDLITSIAYAFAQRSEELVIVFDGLNEFGDAAAIDRFCLSLFEVATTLQQEMHSMPSVEPPLRLIVTSRQEALFGARARLHTDPPASAFHMQGAGLGHLPRPYLEIAPLTDEEREKLFSVYFDDFSETGAEHRISRIARSNPRFAALLNRPIAVVLASELYRKGMRIEAMQSSSDFADIIVDQGFETLAADRRQEAWLVLDGIFERRLRLGDQDVVKLDDILSTQPLARTNQLETLSQLADLNILKPIQAKAQGTIQFFHDRIEEALLGRYLAGLEGPWRGRALETCLVLGEGRTLYQEGLVHYLRDGLVAWLADGTDKSTQFARRWNLLSDAALRTGREALLARILARAFFDLYSGPAVGQLRDNWLAQAFKILTMGAASSAQILARQLLTGVEGMLRTQTGDMTGFVTEVRSGVSSNTDDPSMDLSSLALLAESHNLAERWRDALALLNGAEPDAGADVAAVERFHWAKGVALRYLGKIRDAQHELRLVFSSQLKTNPSLAAAVLFSLVETMRECGDFDEGLAFLDDAASRIAQFATTRDRLRMALWRGVFNKNLMQDAIQFQWDAAVQRFAPDFHQAETYHRRAEEAFAKALVVGATMEEASANTDVAQIHSEMAETALWYAICHTDARPEADRRLHEFSRLLSLNPIVEQQVEYHRYCAQRAALVARFDDARTALEMARKVATTHGMSFLETDCDMDWARFIVNADLPFPSDEIEAAASRVHAAQIYYRDHLGSETYYVRIAEQLIRALAVKARTAALSS